MEQLMRELGLVIDQLWPNYERAALEAGISSTLLHTELVLGGWSPQSRRFEATAYAKSESGVPAVVQRLAGGLASPGEPLKGQSDSFELSDVLSAGKLQAAWLNEKSGRRVAGGNLLALVLRKDRAEVLNLGQLDLWPGPPLLELHAADVEFDVPDSARLSSNFQPDMKKLTIGLSIFNRYSTRTPPSL